MTDHAAPPHEPFDPNDPTLFVEPPKWPKVVGILSIVFASLGLTCMGCGIVSLVVFVPMGEQQMGEPMPAVMSPGVFGYALMGVGILGTLLLLLAGILTVGRKPAGRLAHLVWAGLSIPLTLGNMAYQFNQQAAIEQWAADNPGSPWAQQQNPLGPIIGMAIGLALGLAYPVFCLVWFGFIKKRPEDMTGEPAPGQPA